MSIYSLLRNSKNERKYDEKQTEFSDVEDEIPRIFREQSRFFSNSSGCVSSGTADSFEDENSRDTKQLGSGAHFENTQGNPTLHLALSTFYLLILSICEYQE